MAEKTTVGGVPIECLTGEPAVIWSGWRTLGDRELVREASAKGTHINLAHKCLAYRRNTSIEEAHLYFNKEVEIWITELLQKHQVYRASHILKNVGKNSVEYIFDVCAKCKDPLLRNYLSEYLVTLGQFESQYVESWDIIKSIVNYEQQYTIQDGISSTICIDDVIKLPDNIKEALCTELYFCITDQAISKHITNNVLWDYLLTNNKIDELKFWIDIQYNDNVAETATDIDEKYRSLFTNLSITSDMIGSIESSYASNLSKYLIKNHLCKYGVFVNEERQDIKLILSRVFGTARTLNDLEKILSLKSSNINKILFLRNVEKEVCLAHCNYERNTEQENTKIGELYEALTKMCEAEDRYEDRLIEGIFQTIRYISDDVNKYLSENYIVTLALVFLHLSKELSIQRSEEENSTGNNDIFTSLYKKKTGLEIGGHYIPDEVLQRTLKQIPILQNIIENKPKQDEISMYDLLDGYNNLNVKQLFKWRFKNEPVPHFSSENLVKKYGHSETLTYGYYLKEARPTMAIHNLKYAQSKRLGSVSSQRKSKAAFYAHILALRNLDKRDIVCSCISFIEMLGIDSENLRLHITAANYVQKEINVSIGNLLESIMCKNESDVKTAMTYLENSFEKNFKNDRLIDDSQQFVEALKTWEIIVRFSRTHNASLPESFLTFLANKNYWLEFVLLCQIFSYPANQVLENAKQFENENIREHLLTCLNNAQLKKSHSAIYNEQRLKTRDIRQSLYYKIGVKQSGSPTSVSPISSIDTSSSDSYVSTAEYPIINDSTCSADDDLWLTILKCHQSPDPPGALINASRLTLRPLLTILATCYEPSSTASYCYTWMIISTTDETILSDYKECLDQQVWPANKVFDLLNNMVLCGYINTLSRAYKIFMPDSPFNPFFEFLAECVNYGDFKNCQQNLVEFKTRCLNLKCNKVMDWDCSDATYLNNFYWVALLAVRCIINALAYSLRSSHLQTKFLEILSKCNFQVDLPVQTPDFQCLLRLTKILQRTNVTLNFGAFTLLDHAYDFEPEIQRCIDDLLVNKNYSSALELSTVAGLDSSEIILAQRRNEFKEFIRKDDKVGNEFWNECATSFEKYNVSGEKAAEFFVQHAEKVVSHKERYEILRLAFETLKNVETEQQTIDTLEMAMWKSCILAGPENVQLDAGIKVFNKLKTELLSGLNKLKVTCILTDPNEKDATENLINKLIDSGRLDVALRISTIFNYKHKDLQILMLCLSLAEGEILPNELTSEQKHLFSETSKTKQPRHGVLKNRGLQKLSSSSSLNTSSLSPSSSQGETSKARDENIYKTQTECLSTLEKLLKALNHGTDTCLGIVLRYKLAVRLGKSYQYLLILNNPIQFLQDATESNIENKFEIASDIIVAYKINSESTAKCLAENILANITRAVEGEYEDSISMWGYPLSTSFHVIMELCSDVSLLGWQLLKITNKLLGHSNGENKNVGTLKTNVELLIRSHDCFTTSCNMEGIASVLRKCQNLANTLQKLKYWMLLVRLVTGVGRFTEMSYVFQILKENNQFEFLLGKGLDKVAGLKTALLEFLKRNCPEERELFTLVALHFRMYHEIALMWENEAKDVIKKLISDSIKDSRLQSSAQEVKLTRTENVQKQLQLAVSNYTHATENYLQDKKLHLAGRCSDQSQLVSLQLSLLNTVSKNQQVVCILNLKSEEVDQILCHVLNFSQALIMMHAYNHPVDWANVVYNHCILNGETKYLKDYISVNKLTPALVQDCARRYRLEKSATQTMMNNMKKLVSEISDVECKYMLASQLGFKNIVETMLNNPLVGAYLKDTVWKKGYNAM